jgi:serine/threonine protein kinase
MGEVYLAQDTELNRKVAIKFLPANADISEQTASRFIREAGTAARRYS